MTVHVSNTVANAALDAIATAWGASPLLRIYDGTPPTDTGTALSGNTVLAHCTAVPASAASGTKDMLGGVQTVTGDATGTASFYRLYNSGGTTCHEQGTVGTSGTDVTIDNTSIRSGQSVRFSTWTKTWPSTP